MHCAAVGSRQFDRRLEPPPPFSSWLGYLPSFFCARLTHVFGTAFQGSYGTHWRMSPSRQDRRTGSCWSSFACAKARRRRGGSWAGSRQSASLLLRAGRLPQPLSAADLADLWDSRTAKPSENFSPLENEWDRQDQWRWFSRDDPPPLQLPELLKWRHWRPGKIWSPRPSGTAPRPLRPVCGAHRVHAGHSGGGLPQGGIGPPGKQ